MEWEEGRRPGQEDKRLREKEGLKWRRPEQPSLKGVRSTSLSRCQWRKPDVSRRVGCAAWGLENKHLRLDLSPDQAETQNLVTWTRRVCKTGGRLPGLWTLSHTGLHHSSSLLPWGPHPVGQEEFLCLILLGPFFPRCIPPIPPTNPHWKSRGVKHWQRGGGDTRGWMQRTEAWREKYKPYGLLGLGMESQLPRRLKRGGHRSKASTDNKMRPSLNRKVRRALGDTV